MAEENDLVQISKENLQILQNAHGLLNKLWSGKQGRSFKKLIKEANPDAQIPELDMIEEVTKPYDEKIKGLEENTKKLLERLDAKEKAEKETKEERDMTTQLEDVKKKYDFTEEGMEKVKKRMMDKNNPDAESAAAWVKMQEPKAKPISSSNFGPQTFDTYTPKDKEDELNLLHKNPDKFADQKAAEILNDFASGNEKKYFEFGGTE